ncbi:MAG TPA: L-threonylcarbamoyladenylate synthase [Candidatus Dormibacteraeota bacterium]|nr:L-threonylcarbamoyladenylate synthase [Candidatus Dormibacteraeota bacterium]
MISQTRLEVALEKLSQPGTIGVMPTDTLYGLVCRAEDPAAVARLYSLKKRHQKPGTLLAANVGQLVKLGLKRRYLKAVEQYWPGAVSVIIPCGPQLSYLHQGLQGLAVRIPDDQPLRSLLAASGPLLTSSANNPDQPPASSATQARRYFKSAVDFYIDGPDLSGQLPSTIIRLLDDTVEVVRQGAVQLDRGQVQ